MKRIAFVLMVSTLLIVNVSWAESKKVIITPAAAKTKDQCIVIKSAKARELCRDVITKRKQYYKVYSEAVNRYLQTAISRDRELSEKLPKTKQNCLAGERSMCKEYTALKTERSAIYSWYSAQKTMKLNVAHDIDLSNTETSVSLSTHFPKARIVCKRYLDGSVKCVSTAALLAFYDKKMGEAIIKDINRMYDVVQIGSENQVLVGCGAGVFAGTDLSNIINELVSGTASRMGIVTADGTSKISIICQQIAGASNRQGNNLSGSSGLTGIDSLGNGGICGFSPSTGWQEFVDNAFGMIDALAEECETALVGEGAEPPLEPLPPDPQPKPPEPAPTPPDPCPAGGCTTTTMTTTTTNPNFGTTTTTAKTTYSNGSTVTTETTANSSGTVVSTNINATNANGGIWDYTVTKNSAGGNTTVIIDKKADGTTRMDTWRTNSTGGVIGQSHRLTNSSGKTSLWDRRTKTWKNASGCNSDGCEACSAMGEYVQNQMRGGDCLSSGGRSLDCANQTSESACCNNKSAFPGNPHILMPNPEGAKICAGSPSIDFTEDACKKQCQVASPNSVASTGPESDCASNCTSRISNIGGSVLDAICQEVYLEDACFSSTSVSVPTQPSPWVGGGPKPFDVQSQHRILPPHLGGPGGF